MAQRHNFALLYFWVGYFAAAVVAFAALVWWFVAGWGA